MSLLNWFKPISTQSAVGISTTATQSQSTVAIASDGQRPQSDCDSYSDSCSDIDDGPAGPTDTTDEYLGCTPGFSSSEKMMIRATTGSLHSQINQF